MQQLYFHPTWEKAVSPQDRYLIEQRFDETNGEVEDLIMSPTLRVAINHKGELLVLTLVHNFSHHSTRFKNRTVTLQCGDLFIEQQFTIPELTIAPFTSMPWTFIFEPFESFDPTKIQTAIVEIY